MWRSSTHNVLKRSNMGNTQASQPPEQFVVQSRSDFEKQITVSQPPPVFDSLSETDEDAANPYKDSHTSARSGFG